jgi:DNA replication protein DnaC
MNSAAPGMSCNCDGSGWYRVDVPVSDPRFGKLQRCSCKQSEDAAKLQKLCGLTAAERDYRLSGISAIGDTGRQVAAAKEFIQSPAGILTLWGTTGNAKTVVLMSIVNECVERGIGAVYLTGFDLVGYIRDAFKEDDSALARIRRFESVPVLCLDELDKIKWSEWVEEQITELIDRRYRLGLEGGYGTVIAMNKNPNELPTWIYSRLSDGRNKIIKNADEDMRPLMR